MEINKQLFEDVLSGKLKGTFILRDKRAIYSIEFIRNNTCWSDTHPYKLRGMTYTPNGLTSLFSCERSNDIIDFISETNMKENELTIEIPDNKVVDWDESKKQNKIVLKNKQLTYEDICKKLYKDKIVYFTDDSGDIRTASDLFYYGDSNNATTEHQLECILAKNRLANVCKFLNGDINYSTIESCWSFDLADKEIRITYYRPQEPLYYQPQFVCKSKEIAQQAIEILGEETIKLALKPLGI